MTSSCYMRTGKAQWPGKVLVKVCRTELWAWMWTQNTDFTFTFYMLIFPIMQCFLLEWILDDMAWSGFSLVVTFCSMTALVKTTISCPRGCRCSPTEEQGLSVDCSGPYQQLRGSALLSLPWLPWSVSDLMHMHSNAVRAKRGFTNKLPQNAAMMV